jgi:hypothetical protein
MPDISPPFPNVASMSTHITHMYNGVTYGELVIFANVRIKAHYVDITNVFTFPYLIVESHGLCSSPLQSISRIQRTVIDHRVHLQFRVMCHDTVIKFAFPNPFYHISCPRDVL